MKQLGILAREHLFKGDDKRLSFVDKKYKTFYVATIERDQVRRQVMLTPAAYCGRWACAAQATSTNTGNEGPPINSIALSFLWMHSSGGLRGETIEGMR